MGGRLAGLGQVGRDLWRGGEPVGAHAVDGRHVRRPPDRRRQVLLAPRPEVGAVHLERAARPGAQRPGRHRPRAVRLDELAPVGGQRGGHRLVAAPAVDPDVLGPVDQRDVVLAGEPRDDVGGVAVAHHEPAAEVGVERRQAAGEEPATVGAGRLPEPVVDDEQRDHPASGVAPVGDRRGEGVVVRQAQVAPEPHDRVGHGCVRSRTPGGSPVDGHGAGAAEGDELHHPCPADAGRGVVRAAPPSRPGRRGCRGRAR